MRIGGFLKHSLIDFPGTPCCVVFTVGCNFICPYCHNPELADPSRFSIEDDNSQFWSQEQVLSFLDKRKSLLQGVVITGGEPTLQLDLIDFIEKVREMGFSVKLDTNGTRPKVLEKLLEAGYLDYVAMDIKTSMAEYPAFFAKNVEPAKTIELIVRSIDLIMQKAPLYEFRTTCVKPFMSETIIKDIATTINGASAYFLQKCSYDSDGFDLKFMENPQHFLSSNELLNIKEIAENSGLEVNIR